MRNSCVFNNKMATVCHVKGLGEGGDCVKEGCQRDLPDVPPGFVLLQRSAP